MTQTPEDAASDFADAIAVRELRTIRDTITSKLREAYLAGYAHASNVGPEPEREDWIDPSDLDALLQQANTFPDSELESRADTYTDMRDAMRTGWIDPDDRNDVLGAAATLINEDKATVSGLIGLLDDDLDIDDELASYLEDPSCVRVPYDLRDVLSTGFDLHNIDTLADLATELQWQLALPDRGAA